MSDEADWIYNIIPPEQADDMNEQMEMIEQRSNSGVTVMLSATDESAVEICRTWQEALHGDSVAWIKISSFVSGIIETIEEHLNEEGINPYEN
jgi:tyrosyl-tRNA synthetase